MRTVYSAKVSGANRPCYICQATIKVLQNCVLLFDRNVCLSCAKSLSIQIDEAVSKLDNSAMVKAVDAEAFKKKIVVGYRNVIADALIKNKVCLKKELFKSYTAGCLEYKASPRAELTIRNGSAIYILLSVNGDSSILISGHDLNLLKQKRVNSNLPIDIIMSGSIPMHILARIPGSDPNGPNKVCEIVRNQLEALKQAGILQEITNVN